MLRSHNDLLSAIALLAQAVNITDPTLQQMYISISDCQSVLQQLAQPLRTHAAINASIAQELAANPLCSQMVRPHVLPKAMMPLARCPRAVKQALLHTVPVDEDSSAAMHNHLNIFHQCSSRQHCAACASTIEHSVQHHVIFRYSDITSTGARKGVLGMV